MAAAGDCQTISGVILECWQASGGRSIGKRRVQFGRANLAWSGSNESIKKIFFFFESICILAYSSVNKPGRSYEPLHLESYVKRCPESEDGRTRAK
jgi:hypothetical protein